MFWRIAFLMVFLIGTISVASGQTSTQMDTHALLTELESILAESPETKEECQTLLTKIKTWQEKKLATLEAPKANLRITMPADQARVPERPLVEGTVADPKAKVRVIVHPMEVSDYWVQPSVSVRKDGTWKVMIYIGRPGGLDVGKRFEVMAVANPKLPLKEGNVLSGWPDAQWKSQVIEVTRK